MKNKNILFTIFYWIVGLALFAVSFLFIAFGSLKISLTSFTDETLFRTTVEIITSIPGKIYLLGGNLVTSITLYIHNAIGIDLTQTVNDITYEGFKIDWITCGVLVGSLLVFLIDAIFKKHKTINYTCGSLITLSGVALFFEPYYFWYFNKETFSSLNQYFEDGSGSTIVTNVKINYSNPCVFIGATIILLTGLLIIGYQIYKSIKNKKNTSIENKVIEN